MAEQDAHKKSKGSPCNSRQDNDHSNHLVPSTPFTSKPLIAAHHPEPNEQEAKKVGGVLKERWKKRDKDGDHCLLPLGRSAYTALLLSRKEKTFHGKLV